MFRKPVKVSAQTLLKQTERRNMRQQLVARFSYFTENPQLFEEVFPPKAEVTRTRLHPRISIYSVNGEPLFFETGEGEYFPTVYLLWRIPNLIPCLPVWAPVIARLQSGADLMLPGVILPPTGLPGLLETLPPSFKAGEPFAVVAGGVPSHPHTFSVPLAVGAIYNNEAWLASSNMQGRGLRVMHCFRDHLWMMGSKALPPSLMWEAEEADDLADVLAEMTVDEEEHEAEAVEELIGPDEMDRMLEKAFLVALKTKVTAKDCPLTISAFFSSRVLVSGGLDIKQSNYKKLSKLTAWAKKLGVITVKEMGGEPRIMKVQTSHPAFASIELPEMKAGPVSGHVSSVTVSSVGPLVITELFRPVNQMVALFEGVEGTAVGKTVGYIAEDATKVLWAYVKREELQITKPDGASEVLLNPFLANTLFKSAPASVTSVSHKTLKERFFSVLQPLHMVERPGQAEFEPLLKKGALKPIELEVKSRQGRKRVTTAVGMEAFLINPAELAPVLARACSCSASVHRLPGKGVGEELVIQGDVLDKLVELLVKRYGVPTRWLLKKGK